jgi:hypothetical protein
MKVPPETVNLILSSIPHSAWTMQLICTIFTVSLAFQDVGKSVMLKHLCLCAEDVPRTLPVPGYEHFRWFLVSRLFARFPHSTLGSHVRRITLYISAPEQMVKVKKFLVRLKHVNHLDILMSPIRPPTVVCSSVHKDRELSDLMQDTIASVGRRKLD